jgi:hypothetical protein
MCGVANVQRCALDHMHAQRVSHPNMNERASKLQEMLTRNPKNRLPPATPYAKGDRYMASVLELLACLSTLN